MKCAGTDMNGEGVLRRVDSCIYTLLGFLWSPNASFILIVARDVASLISLMAIIRRDIEHGL